MGGSVTIGGRGARAFRVTGQVQGVGFRPFVCRLARSLSLSGTVKNDPAGVTVRLSGPREAVDEFLSRLRTDAPSLARVDRVEDAGPAGEVAEGFEIETSDLALAPRGRITPDAATCPDCLAEMADPSRRRYRYGLTNCTACGPRYSILQDLPWDRPRTSMASFPMCEACHREYEDPSDRRFHAEPVCCPECGPRVRLEPASGAGIEGDPYRSAAALLGRGGILAMKGLGGYHLVVDARDDAAVAKLRREKHRDAKPFAVMVRDLDAARGLAVLSPEGEKTLVSTAAPIVLAPNRGGLAAEVSGPSHRVGVMLPGNPMQHLLLGEVDGPVVMTSGNSSDDPLVTADEDARHRLSFADAFLSHARRIERAVDDSVVIDGPFGIVPVRRARGFAPSPVDLPVASPVPGIALGGDLKSAVAVVTGSKAVLSPHLGDLEHALAYRRFESTIEDLIRLLGIRPRFVAGDLHPDYLSTRHAARIARAAGRPPLLVAHHHAHLAALLAEHGRTDRILGLVLDGAGYGPDGGTWGGEVLAGDLLSFERIGRLRPLALPGGDAAARQIDRCALSWLYATFGEAAARHPAAARACPDAGRRAAIFGMLARRVACPVSSGAGRLFDAAASLLGFADRNRFEAESGMALEAAATRAGEGARGGGEMRVFVQDHLIELDPRPLLEPLLRVFLVRGPEAAAFFFHDALAEGFARAAVLAGERTGIRVVGLSGGVFLNQLLLARLRPRLTAAGLLILQHRVVPPGDGGLALGQSAISAARLAAGGPGG